MVARIRYVSPGTTVWIGGVTGHNNEHSQRMIKRPCSPTAFGLSRTFFSIGFPQEAPVTRSGFNRRRRERAPLVRVVIQMSQLTSASLSWRSDLDLAVPR